jgi:hypothetical protein
VPRRPVPARSPRFNNFHDFVPACLSPHDAHSGSRHPEMLRQGLDDSFIGPALTGCRSHRDAEVGGTYLLNAFAPGSGDDSHSDAHLTTTFPCRRLDAH